MTTPTPAAYYGPQTFSEGITRIEALVAQGAGLPATVEHVTERMAKAGYNAEAKRVAKYFRSSLKTYEKSLARRTP